ncbi:unnamed protein product, partial [Nesidiocoris tenuis]
MSSSQRRYESDDTDGSGDDASVEKDGRERDELWSSQTVRVSSLVLEQGVSRVQFAVGHVSRF